MRAGRPVSTPVLLFLVGLGIRLIFLWENTANPTFDLPVVDAAVYNDLAVGLVSGHGMTEGFFWQPFFYPMFLAAVYRLVGQSPLVVRVIQAIVGAATCVLVYHLGLRAFSRRTGIVAAIIVAFYGPLIFFEGELLAATWAAFWCTATVLLLLKVRENPSVGNLALLGAAGSLGFLTRPTIAPFFLAGCICVGFALRRSLDLRSRLVRALVLVLACGAFLAPVAVLNHRVTGYFTVMPSSGPYNFYLGNNPESAHTEALRPGEEALRLYRQAADTGFVGGQGAAVCFAQKNRSYVRAK
ncbi:MAG: glycosyltransferase family 39 protein, partial [Armatimonadetes bacterium]|nr:glycosyltransferase family 39 protein [Armatimonadota bacterium]